MGSTINLFCVLLDTDNQPIRMKIAIVVCALVAVTLSQQHQPHNNPFGDLIHREVQAILKADPALSVDNCATKCDAEFDLIDGHDETATDRACKDACNCEINKTCHSHTRPTHASHTRPHFTRPHPPPPPPKKNFPKKKKKKKKKKK